ncbi:MAG: hypothetical protein KJN87_11065 [Desulfofustis sp.]|nr:hypothetical protein [Desulfofustis sp.]
MKRLFCSLSILLALLIHSPVKGSSALDSPAQTTLAAFRQVDCMDDNRYNYYKEIIAALSYTRMRALRAFCSLDEIYAHEAIESLEKLVFAPLSFEQVLFFETFAALDGATVVKSWRLLELTAELDFTTMQTVAAIGGIEEINADMLIDLVRQVKALDGQGRWAAKALFGVEGVDREAVVKGLRLLGIMTAQQRLSAEQSFLIKGMDSQTIMKILPQITSLSHPDSINSRGLFSLETTTPDQALFWLQSYFSLPKTLEDQKFYTLSPDQRSFLLASYESAADAHIRIINDLHAVTNNFGGEISTGTLVSGGQQMVIKHFATLHPKARNSYRQKLDEALDQNKIYQAIDLLKQATAYARKQTARDLTTANIYILLSRGSELYDSSFRDVLVPVLLSRLGQAFNGNLLLFLKQTDPANNHVSDFIVSCAQKGKLTAFFPQDSVEQRAVLDLMAQSAFKNEQSLILFSATFADLLDKLQPDARTYLLNKMIATIGDPNSTFSLQLRVILQFYYEKNTQLLAATDRKLISDLIDRYGSIDLSSYTATDFTRWKADGRLSSLSIFQDDDDGRISYLSNSRNLINNGYRPRLPETINLLDNSSPMLSEASRLMAQGKTASLYRLSLSGPLIVEYYKTVNGIELTHAVTVYHKRDTQRRLLKKFLISGMEMFAQRGHSYWREEQLLDPMRELLESGEIDRKNIPDINRFLSIGSCGGIRIYSELNRLFDNTIDIFATVGTGKAVVNDPYNQRLFEIIATSPNRLDWDEISTQLDPIFAEGRGSDYLQPGSLPAILHKMMDTRS